MKPLHKSKEIKTQIFVEFEDGSKQVVKYQDKDVMMFMHLDGSVIVARKNGEQGPKIKSLIPMLYTGLNDIHGKEIYDHDVIEVVYNSKAVKGIVQWCESNHAFYLTTENDDNLMLDAFDRVTKIGNYYFDNVEDIRNNIETAEVVQGSN